MLTFRNIEEWRSETPVTSAWKTPLSYQGERQNPLYSIGRGQIQSKKKKLKNPKTLSKKLSKSLSKKSFAGLGKVLFQSPGHTTYQYSYWGIEVNMDTTSQYFPKLFLITDRQIQSPLCVTVIWKANNENREVHCGNLSYARYFTSTPLILLDPGNNLQSMLQAGHKEDLHSRKLRNYLKLRF